MIFDEKKTENFRFSVSKNKDESWTILLSDRETTSAYIVTQTDLREISHRCMSSYYPGLTFLSGWSLQKEPVIEKKLTGKRRILNIP